MYTISKNSQIVLALLKAHGIKHIVINPGATNIPLVSGFQNDPFFTCYSIVDERSAMYFAIGLSLEKGEPVATTCTSAQATRNYVPGLTEAYYKHVPILAITASKHPKYFYQDYMQAPEQTSLPNDAIKKTFALPYVSNKIDELHCVRLVNEAILELSHRRPGPIQLNVPMIDSELGQFTINELSKTRIIRRYMGSEEWNVSLKDKKVMIVIGEHRPFTQTQLEALEAFTESNNAFVYVNHLSNYHGKYAVSANLALTCMDGHTFENIYKPDILITIGGQTGDYPLFGKLSGGGEFDFEHWRVSEDGDIVDTYDKLTKVFECPLELFFKKVTNQEIIQHTYYQQWKDVCDSMKIPANLPLSNAYLAQELHKDIPKNSYLNLAILNSLRTWSFYPLDPSVTCYSNVGAFGIDGCLSVLLGQSVATERLCFMVIGDLSFFYDMNSIGIRHLKNNIRILLVNNHCGAEFKLYLNPAYQFGKEGDKYIAAAGHNSSNVQGWVEANGFKYLSAKSKEEFLETKNQFLTESSNLPIVFEVFTNHEDESSALKMIVDNNQIKSTKTKIKEKLESVFGEHTVETLKKIVKK